MHDRFQTGKRRYGPAVLAAAALSCALPAAAAPAAPAASRWAGSYQCYCAKTALGVNEIGRWTVRIDQLGVVVAAGEMDQQVRRMGAGPDQRYEMSTGHYTATGTVTGAGVIHWDAASRDAQYYARLPLTFDGAYDPETKSFHGHYYYGAKPDAGPLGTWY